MRTDLIIGALLAFQLIVPLTYYLRDDPYDERFAWRMFSAIRMQSCSVEVREKRRGEDADVRLQLLRVIHEGWITTLERNRRDVILALLERRCDEPEVERVVLVSQCQGTDGQPLRPLRWVRACASGDVTESEDP